MSEKKQNWPKALANAINLGTSVAAAIAIGLLGGRWLDDKFGTEPLITILGLLLGVATAGKMMWERLMADNVEYSPPDAGEKKEPASTEGKRLLEDEEEASKDPEDEPWDPLF
ncbi:MAG TPA: AtpZ/AtpI family protein [Syntrophomonadaceae bacterium]|nr:AtpZ/AtpI family protein [Syntrophomonadaceae bacterium]